MGVLGVLDVFDSFLVVLDVSEFLPAVSNDCRTCSLACRMTGGVELGGERKKNRFFVENFDYFLLQTTFLLNTVSPGGPDGLYWTNLGLLIPNLASEKM